MFSDINFKYTDASEEKVYSPEIIDECYVDVENILEKISEPAKYIVVGPKGSGKSALSSKLQREADGKWDRFVSTDELENFEFNLLEKTGGDKGKVIGGAISVWQFLLLVRILGLLLRDEKFKELNAGVKSLADALEKHGVSPSNSLVAIVQQTSRRGAYFALKAAYAEIRGDGSSEATAKIKDPAAMLESIKDVFKDVRPAKSSYRFVIDGLDHPLKNGRSNAAYLGDLINAARAVNLLLGGLRLDAKVVILIRDEVLQLIPDPNLAKRINDNGIFLRWYDNTRDALRTPLLRIIEKRAHLVKIEGTIEKLWLDWFPAFVDTKESVSFILDNTRFLPRDLISFFRELQNIHKEPPFNRAQVLAALSNYSEWFLQELSDSIVGFVPEELRKELPSLLSELGRRFKFSDFQSKLIEHGFSVDKYSAEDVAKDLFNTSWFGNVWKTNENTDRFSFRHRKRNAAFNKNHEIIIHNGLWKALNLV
jgi:hypothetical protein